VDSQAILPSVDADGFGTSWMAPVYALVPDQVAKGQWLKMLVKKHADFIGLRKGGVDVKALDYAAGTGFLSHVSLTPSYVSDGLVDFVGIGSLRQSNLCSRLRPRYGRFLQHNRSRNDSRSYHLRDESCSGRSVSRSRSPISHFRPVRQFW